MWWHCRWLSVIDRADQTRRERWCAVLPLSVKCYPFRAVTLPNIGVPHRVTYQDRGGARYSPARRALQGYLAHKKTPPSRTLQ